MKFPAKLLPYCLFGTRQIGGVQPDSHRPGVVNLDEHFGLELAGLDFEAHRAKFFDEAVTQRRGDFRPRGVGEARAAALSTIGVERELRNDQHLGPRIYRRQIELALAVREY